MTAEGAGDGRAVRLERGAGLIGVPLSARQRARLIALVDLLEHWNRAFNLTAVRDPEAMIAQHLLDSLAVAPYLAGESVLDLGTGPGLPGLPLAIVQPERRFWLLDANGKKIRFVRQAVAELELENVEPVQARMESYRPEGNFSTIVARALASVAEIHASASQLLASPGRLLLMKGRYPAEELADPALAGLPLTVHPLQVPFLASERHLVEIRRG